VEGAASLLPLLLFVAVFWLLLIRPQRKRQRELMDLQGSVQPGADVMLSAGMFGRVTGTVDDPAAGELLLVEVAPGVEIKVARGAVMRVVEPVTDEADVQADADDDARGA
jgi:preprotein translocase subunit YajC